MKAYFKKMASEAASCNNSYFSHEHEIRMIGNYDYHENRGNLVSASSGASENNNMWINSASSGGSNGSNDNMPNSNNNNSNSSSNSSINSGNNSSSNSNIKNGSSSSSSSSTSSTSSSSHSISNSNDNNTSTSHSGGSSSSSNNGMIAVPGHGHIPQNMSWNLITVAAPLPPNSNSVYSHHHHHHHHPSFHHQRGYPDSRYLHSSGTGLNLMDAASLNNHHLLTLSHSNSGINQTYKRYLQSGKSGNSKDLCGDDKHKEDGDPWSVDAPAAFLGPNLWDRTLPYEADLKVHPYVDLDEFLSENCIPSVDGLQNSHLTHATSLGHRSSDSLSHGTGLSLGLNQITKRERSPSPSDCMSPDTINPPSPADSTFSMASTGREFDPRTRAFSDEELKPQPMIKKSRKQFVPDELKDDKYWARRRKNNMAAKRSRDARRMKENQIALRAGFLEKENMSLHRELEQLKQENMELRARLSKYQEV